MMIIGGCLLGIASCKTRTLGAIQSQSLNKAVLEFSIDEGPNSNHFYRGDAHSVHLVATSGAIPRIIFAFPAANSNAAFVMESGTREPVDLRVVKDSSSRSITPLPSNSAAVSGRFRATTPTLKVKQKHIVLGSVRVTRELLEGSVAQERLKSGSASVPDELRNMTIQPDPDGASISFSRVQLDGKNIVAAIFRPDGDTTIQWDPDQMELTLEAKSGGASLGFEIEASITNRPLQRLVQNEIFKETISDSDDLADRQALEFLSSKEKLLAGSWRFMTYFGRDTLLSARMLRPKVTPEFMHAALGSVISRLGGNGMLSLEGQISHSGMVAHEEDIGDYANMHHSRSKRLEQFKDTPRYDYGMVDSDFLLGPVLADFLSTRTPQETKIFLATKATRGAETSSYQNILMTHFSRVVALARPFSLDPVPKNLIHLLPERPVGDWRDSEDGLGGGVVSFNVNASLVPAALNATSSLLRSEPFASMDGSTSLAAEAAAAAAVWSDKAVRFFEVEITPLQAQRQQASYCTALKINCAPSGHGNAVVTFDAVSLDRSYKPVPVMHSDHGFELLFNVPNEKRLKQIAQQIAAPFPEGLLTGAGMVVANPVYGDPKIRKLFNNGSYHGTVVWSWQQAMMAAGLERQTKIKRDQPLSPATIAALTKAQTELWKVIRSNWAWRRSELWGLKVASGGFKPLSFTELTKDGTEPNAIQLWSTVYLAVRPPN
jgi:hypothetical protein